MKKIFLTFGLFASISASMALSTIECPTNYKSTSLGTCNTCFSETLYKGQSYDNLSDSISVTSGQRLVYFDETGVNWSQINANFTLTSDLNEDRTSATGFKRSILPDQPRMGWFDSSSGRKFSVYKTGDSNIKYVESTGGITFVSPLNSATASMKDIPMWRIVYDLASHDYTGNTLSSTIDHHLQCVFVYPKWCGDGIKDDGTNGTPNKGEQCDDGNMVSGDGCSNTCTNETQTLSCTNLTLSPAQLTKNGGSLSATCAASVTSGTQYKLVLKQGATTLETIEYQSSATKTFAYTLPANGSTTDKTYSVECYVKNGTQSSTCNKNITVPGTPLEPAVCNSLTVAPTSAYVNTPIAYSCSATNATSYVIKSGSVVLGSTPEGTFNFPTAGTYIIGCFINGQTNGPAECAKTVTITNPPVSTIPNIFIDKDDSTPGTPDSDGNDTQRVQTNGTATFTIRVLNNGNEALKTVVIDDSLASDCARTASQTATLYAGGTTTHFDIGESFTYTCSKNNVTNSTFPNNRNTASVKGVGVTSGTNVTDSDVTEIFLKQGNPSIKVEKDDDDNSDDEQEIDEDDTATFTVEVTNDGDEALENVELADDLSPDCDRDESETRDMIRDIGNHDSLFDPDESFTYTCKERSVTIDTFPDEENTVCVEANGVDTDEDVDDCDDTKIIVIENEDDTEEDFVCENIESSEGTFGGAPFRTIITCDAQEDDTCEIEVVRDGEIINTYDSCSKSITFSETGDYSVACIVNDDRSSDCEMEITVEAMTDIPTGTKILILAFLSLILSAIGMHFYKKKTI